MPTYTEVQTIWYQQLSTLGAQLLVLMFAFIFLKKFISHPMIFRIVIIALFAIPLALAELLSLIRS